MPQKKQMNAKPRVGEDIVQINELRPRTIREIRGINWPLAAVLIFGLALVALFLAGYLTGNMGRVFDVIELLFSQVREVRKP